MLELMSVLIGIWINIQCQDIMKHTRALRLIMPLTSLCSLQGGHFVFWPIITHYITVFIRASAFGFRASKFPKALVRRTSGQKS